MYDSTHENVVTKIQSPDEKAVVLTFDDGPSRLLPRFLDVLKQENVPAVFFWQTRLLHPQRPWQRVLDEGHIIGSHTVKHRNLVELPKEEQYKDIKNSITAIEQITGSPVRFFRPPYGRFNAETLQVTEQLSLTPVMWKIASMDWELKNDPQRLIANVTENLENGAVILLHELPQTLEALPGLIAAIKERGYGFKLL
ncbi:polysaccharide deacetylase family protein [Planococcus shixiaomingii]|uniref:polysaccharide deacetylase family protein n=1 Tax=Planococcus shixiaomingii TaxID=3058393 RepID=UPI002623671E|nr:polysaccharide deacetylase family protein [Planococcus sp. N022]WKA54590.1 polysaccharide deacetylase family protein [Planococcus sp. N022]